MQLRQIKLPRQATRRNRSAGLRITSRTVRSVDGTGSQLFAL